MNGRIARAKLETWAKLEVAPLSQEELDWDSYLYSRHIIKDLSQEVLYLRDRVELLEGKRREVKPSPLSDEEKEPLE